MDKDKQVEILLDQSYYVIDFLPRQVQKDEGPYFFEVEEYFFNDKELKRISNKFVRIILKTLCYFEFSIYTESWLETVSPDDIAKTIKDIVIGQKGFVNILLTQENVLLHISGGDLNIAVHNCNKNVESIMEALALSEGLFWWKVND